MSYNDVWSLARKAWLALTAHYGPAIDRAAEEHGIPLGEWYGWLMAARIFEPDPVSSTRLKIRSAYTALPRLEADLAKGVQLGLLEPAGHGAALLGAGGEYYLTRQGHRAVQHLIDTAYAAMADLRPLPDDDLQRLAGLLWQLVEASLAAPEPPGKWCLRIARHFDPGAGAPVVVRIDQYLSDLKAYRDDAFLAAWRPHGVTGQAWEAFTLLWRGAAATPDELLARLPHRGFGRGDYVDALQELIARGWVAEDHGLYSVTGPGLELREATEATADRYFYAAWQRVGDAEIDELRELLARFRDALAPAQG